MGRPPVPPDDKRVEGVTLRLSKEEKALLESVASVAGMRPAVWARELLLRAAARTQQQQHRNTT